MPQPSALHVLADRHGILSDYLDILGTRRLTEDETRVALLNAMGIDASTEASATTALERERERDERCFLDPVVVVRARRSGPGHLAIGVPTQFRGRRVDYRLSLDEESGRRSTSEGRIGLKADQSSARLSLPLTPTPGYHRVRVQLSSGSNALDSESALIACPRSCLRVGDVIGERPRYGVWAQLYGVRSRNNWGIGDLADLKRLAEWASELGASFVGVNPLYALRNSGGDISPYNPVSRLYLNPIYLDVGAIPELAECPEARATIESPEYRSAIARLRSAPNVDYEKVMTLKQPVLELLHRTFLHRHRGSADERGRSYAGFIEREGELLEDYATFAALDRHFAAQGLRDWRTWPPGHRDPRSERVAAFREGHREEIDRYRYIQFELDRQLNEAASAARLPIGLYGDLPIGTAMDGSDPWAFPGLFLSGAHVGAPPDDYSRDGQDWGLPPLDPSRLKEGRYRYWIQLLRNSLRHVGALRIDHVMGLFRQYWVPAGRPATAGAYVRYPADDLLGILALESQRQRALIVGEDLGTVPRGLPATLARWGILSSSVLYFERTRRGTFKPARQYSKRALVTANTHDHPPLQGFWLGRDLEIRNSTGSLQTQAEYADAREQRRIEREALLRRLRAEECLAADAISSPYPELPAAVHSFLSRTPAPLVGVWLDDLAGEADPVNVPGLGIDRYKGWSRKTSPLFEDLKRDPAVRHALGTLPRERAFP